MIDFTFRSASHARVFPARRQAGPVPRPACPVRSELALLRAEPAHPRAHLALQRAEPALQVAEFALQVGQFFPGDCLAHFGLQPGHRRVQLGHLLADVGSGNAGLLPADRPISSCCFPKRFLLAAKLFLLLAQRLHRLIHRLDLFHDGGSSTK